MCSVKLSLVKEFKIAVDVMTRFDGCCCFGLLLRCLKLMDTQDGNCLDGLLKHCSFDSINNREEDFVRGFWTINTDAFWLLQMDHQ